MDMVQDTFLALMSKLTGFAADGQAASWLLTVATNRCLNEIRRNRYWKTETFDETRPVSLDQPQTIVENRLLFQKLLVSLPEAKASIVAGYFLEGMTMDEVAAENRVSLPTVRRTVAAFLERGEAVTRGDVTRGDGGRGSRDGGPGEGPGDGGRGPGDGGRA
jgi:RNA polymerase sigma-70 factor (ECF subfamily)